MVLRLDKREAALSGGDSQLQAIVPGNADGSELIKRITSTDPDVVMPPSHHAEQLKPEQNRNPQALDCTGAEYVEHWAFVPPKKEIESVPNDGNVIDHFGRQKTSCSRAGFSQKKSVLFYVARLYLDLIGCLLRRKSSMLTPEKGTRQPLINSWRALGTVKSGTSLVGCCSVLRYEWIRKRYEARAVDLEGLGDRGFEQRYALQSIHHRTDCWRSTSQCDAIPDDCHGFLRNSMIKRRGGDCSRTISYGPRCLTESTVLARLYWDLPRSALNAILTNLTRLLTKVLCGMFAFLNNCYEAQSWVYTPEQLAKKEEVLKGLQSQYDQVKQERPLWADEQQKWIDSVTQQLGNWKHVVFDDLNSVSGLNHPTQEHDMSVLDEGAHCEDVYMIGEPELEWCHRIAIGNS